MSTDAIKMPNFRVDLRLNKLSSDWQFARAVLEDEYVGLDKTLNQFRTRYDFAKHLLDVHRMWCVRRAIALPSRCLPGRSDGEAADAVQSKNYVSASTQTDTHSHFEERNPDTDLHIKQELVSEKLYDVHMESSMNESTSEERHEDEIPTPYSASDVHSYFIENTNQVSDLLIKPEVVPHDHCGVRIERSTNESTNLLRNEEGLPMQHNRSEVDSQLEETDPLSDLLIKQEVVSQEIYDVHLDTTESTSHQGHGEGIATHNIGSDGNLVDIYNEPSTSTMHHDVDSLELSSQGIGTADRSIWKDIGRPSGTRHHREKYSPGASFPDVYDAGVSSSMNAQNPSKPERKKSFQCKSCSKTFSSLGVFHLHLKTHTDLKLQNQSKHFNEKPYQCLVCEKDFISKPHLDVHMRKHSGQKIYQCGVCNKVFKFSGHLTRHMRIHAGEKPFKCSYCGYRSSQNSNLIRHMKKHSGENPNQCSICKKVFASSSHLSLHMATHAGDKPYKCNCCSYRSSDRNNLALHMRTHSQQKPYQCYSCKIAFTTSGQLSDHMIIHTGEKPFKCSFCSYSSSEKGSLKRHMRTHTGEKPFKCNFCSYRSSDSSSLKRHMRTHTGEKPFECSCCNYRCSQKSNLKLHMRKHTREKPY